MRRRHWIELEDQPWFPASLRNCMTDLLNFFITFFRIYDPIVPILYKAIIASRSNKILDLCSGGSGAIIRIQNIMGEKYNYKIQVTLSDLYPNIYACARINKLIDYSIFYLPEPTDATQVSSHLNGFRTLFTSFHHFDPESARKILINAVENQRGIAVFELSERALRGTLGPIISSLLIFLVTPFIRPFCVKRIFLTYIIPIIPIVYLFDGIMSQLRSYTPEEMLMLAREVCDGSYTWESGCAWHSFLPLRINYLVGYKSVYTAKF